MTKEQAEVLVDDLIDAVADYERAVGFDRRYYRGERNAIREKVIAALTSAQGGRE